MRSSLLSELESNSELSSPSEPIAGTLREFVSDASSYWDTPGIDCENASSSTLDFVSLSLAE
jgi:hypothetical protein